MPEWTPSAKYCQLLGQASEILENGERRTVRDVYYALEARGYDWEYRQVKRALKKGRRAGYIDPQQIYDATRPPEREARNGYDTPASYLEIQLDYIEHGYFENWWHELPTYVEVWLEKQSLASVFNPVCHDYNVRLEATRGDWSDSKVFEARQRLDEHLDRGQDVRILYFGDYNPSGYHAPVAVQSTMQEYGLDLGRDDGLDADHPCYFKIFPFREPIEYEGGGTLAFERVSINTEHVEEFDLPENPTPSSTDKDRKLRHAFRKFVSDGRDVNIELNALKEFQRDYLEDLIEDAIRQHIDPEVKRRVEQRTKQRRREIKTAVDELRDGLAGGA